MNELKPAFSVTKDGEDFEVLMSFGLLNELTSLIGDPARCAAIYFNPVLREQVLVAVLSQRDKKGKIISPIENVTDVDVPLDQIEELIAWVVEHCLGFFARSLQRVMGMKEQLTEMEGLVSSLPGSKA